MLQLDLTMDNSSDIQGQVSISIDGLTKDIDNKERLEEYDKIQTLNNHRWKISLSSIMAILIASSECFVNDVLARLSTAISATGP